MATLAWAAPEANSTRAVTAMRKERILPLASRPLYKTPALRLPAPNMPGNRHWFQWPAPAIVNACRGANKAAGRRNRQQSADIFASGEEAKKAVIPGWSVRTRPQVRNCAPGNLEILRCAIAHH